jgi:hypothetical protein
VRGGWFSPHLSQGRGAEQEIGSQYRIIDGQCRMLDPQSDLHTVIKKNRGSNFFVTGDDEKIAKFFLFPARQNF